MLILLKKSLNTLADKRVVAAWGAVQGDTGGGFNRRLLLVLGMSQFDLVRQAVVDTAGMAALPIAVAFGMTFFAVLVLVPFARRVGLVDRPGGRKAHETSTPAVGGLAIAVGVVIATLMISAPTRSTSALGLAGLILVVTGIVDDLKNLKWWVRLLAQVAAALTLVNLGGVRVELIGPVFGLEPTSLGSLSMPFTVLATVGLINALNMVDGLDGLAGSLVSSSLIMLAGCSIYAGNPRLAAGLLVIAAATVGFLYFNLRSPWRANARIFLGNAGSEFLGLVMAWAAFRLTQNPLHPVSPVLAPFLIAPPVIDCLALVVRRALKGRSPFSADREHFHHLLLAAGFSTTAVVVTIVGYSVAIGAVAMLVMKLHLVPQWVFLAAYLAMTLGYFALTLKPERAVALFVRIRKALGIRDSLTVPAPTAPRVEPPLPPRPRVATEAEQKSLAG